MSDVAAMAKVSYQTVSRVVHEHPNVRSTTRSRVLAAIDILGYRPNSAARALVTGSSHTLGILALDTPSSTGLVSQYAIEQAARDAGYYVSIATIGKIDPSSFLNASKWLLSQSIDGLLVIAPTYSANEIMSNIANELPLVVVEGDPDTGFTTVSVDQASGANEATEHLLSLGHSTVFHITGPSDWRQTDERISGWRQALESRGAEINIPMSGDWGSKSGYEIGRTLAKIPELTAIFAASDRMALGAMHALIERGRRVPEDVAVVGFDDIPEASYFNPSLTTVRQDFREVGARALCILLGQINSGAKTVVNEIVDCTLIVRESSNSTIH